MNAQLSSNPALCLYLTQHARDFWLSVLPCFAIQLGSSEGPRPQMYLVQGSKYNVLPRSEHMCSGESLQQESLAPVKTIMEPALPSSQPPNPPNYTRSPPETTQVSRKPSAHPQPSLLSLALECPQHREHVPQDFKLAVFCSHCFLSLICWTNID